MKGIVCDPDNSQEVRMDLDTIAVAPIKRMIGRYLSNAYRPVGQIGKEISLRV